MYLVKCVLLLFVAVAGHGFSLGPTDIIFHLYTRSNPTASEPLFPSQASILASNFQPYAPTIFTIHNYDGSVTGNFNAHVVPVAPKRMLKESVLSNAVAHLTTEDVNVIAVDWSRGASSYTFGLSNAPQVGQVIAQFINILTSNLILYDIDNIRLVGVGLGAHIAGITGRSVNGRLQRIIALDPSLPGWTHHPEILNKDDAEVVEVIHTTAGVYGYDKPLGDIDFYPNGGNSQVNCGTLTSCSHQYSYIFYAESITTEILNGNRFVGTACNSYEEAITLSCSGNHNVIFGGTSNNKSGASGIYVFLTNMFTPFARG